MTHFVRSIGALQAPFLLLCGCLAFGGRLAVAATDDVKHSTNFSIATGVQYDSKLSVPELEAVVDKSDYATLIEGNGRYEAKFGNSELGVSYDFFQRIQFDYSQFDLQIHNVSARFAHNIGQVTASLAGNYVYSELDDQSYLTMKRITPALSGFVSRHVFARAALDVSEKDFDAAPPKDADVLSPSLRLYYFFNNFQTHVYGAYRYEDEDAADSRFSYDSHRIRLGLSHKFDIFKKEARLRIESGFETIEYKGITPLIGTERDEENITFNARLEIPITSTIYTQFEYQYLDKSSNVDYLDYNQFTADFKIGARF